MPKTPTFIATLLMASTRLLMAGAGDPTLRTDHPIYPGEGAFQTIEDCVSFATNDQRDEQAKAIALFNWMLQHQFHLASPQEPTLPGITPDTENNHYDTLVEDAERARFSYGYGLCGTVHTWNEPYWAALNMRARRRAFPGHTNSEIEYGGSWHTFDTDMAGLVMRPDGVVAGYEDIIKDPSMVQVRPGAPVCYPFAWPGDFEGMKKGWQEVSKNPSKYYKMYQSGFAAHPGIVSLRRGETFTRIFDRDHFGGPDKRRYWHNQQNGPARNWTFVNKDQVTQAKPNPNALGNASYANALFEYEPDLKTRAYEEGVAHRSDNLKWTPGHLQSGDGKAASITFAHFSPYVICGDPVDNVDPMTKPATDGLVISGQSKGTVSVQLSTDQGQSWQEPLSLKEDFKVDLTDAIKGRYGWHLRFNLEAGADLSALRFVTTSQMAQPMYPRLKAGGSQVTYRTAQRSAFEATPNFGLIESELQSRGVSMSDNVRYTPRSPKNRNAFTTKNNKPGDVIFRIEAPEDLIEIRAAARFGVRIPTPDNADFHLEVSFDQGKTWKTFAKTDIPKDNDYSSGWVYGQAQVKNARQALVRVHFYNGGYTANLLDVRLYGIHRTPAATPAHITYAWREGGKTREFTTQAQKAEHTFTVPTGAMIEDQWVRIQIP